MKIIVIISLILCSLFSIGQKNQNAILGRWITAKGDCIVEVYKQMNEFKAKVVWVNDKGSKTPVAEWVDDKNPNKSLRSRKIIGIEVLRNLKYNADDNEWQDGLIYDATSGKEWDSVVWLTKDNLLKVKGYFLVKFLSETHTFKRVDDISAR